MSDPMSSETVLAWALADTASVCFTQEDRARVFTALGAGEWYSAIRCMLAITVRAQYALPDKLVVQLTTWLDSYTGSADEPTMRSLLGRVRPHTRHPPARG